MEKTFTFDMASKAYADYILNSKDRYAPLIVEIPEGIEDIEPQVPLDHDGDQQWCFRGIDTKKSGDTREHQENMWQCFQ